MSDNERARIIIAIALFLGLLVIVGNTSQSLSYDETYDLTINVTLPCRIVIYSEGGLPIFKAEVNNASSVMLSLTSGKYFLAVTSSCDSTIKVFFKCIELTSNMNIRAKLVPLVYYQNKTIIVKVVYPNGSPAADINVMAYPIGLPNMLYMTKTNEDGFAELQVLDAPIIVEAQSEPIPLKTKKVSISEFIQAVKRESSIEPHQLTSQGEVIVVEEALLYKAKKVIHESFGLLTLHEEHVGQLNQFTESLVEETYSSLVKGEQLQSTTQEESGALGVDPLIASLGITSFSALAALIVFIMIRNKI
ncbi:MAG: hypothetical protein ACXQTI_02930 [Candidatus Nezhaarchaeales archaeon]